MSERGLGSRERYLNRSATAPQWISAQWISAKESVRILKQNHVQQQTKSVITVEKSDILLDVVDLKLPRQKNLAITEKGG